jgi:hypothetical protein
MRAAAYFEMAMMPAMVTSASNFRLDTGGPFHRLGSIANVTRPAERAFALAMMTWVPFMALAALGVATGHRIDPLLSDLSVHARLLVALPLLVAAEVALDRRARVTIARLVDDEYVPDDQAGRFRAILARAARLRDARAAEAIILCVSLLLGVAAMVGWLSPSGLASGVTARGPLTAARLWYCLIALPTFQFVSWRLLWRWAIWARVLGGLSQMPLRLATAHPDRRAGIAFVKRPSVAFAAIFSFAGSIVLCAAWYTTMVYTGARLSRFVPELIAFALFGVAIAFAPLLLFAPRLWSARLTADRQVGGLAADYSRRFDRRWLETGKRDELLGTPDIQSLSDIGNSFQQFVDKMSPLLFDLRDVVLLLVATLLPTIPLLLREIPLAQALKTFLRLLAGGG